MLEIVRLRKLKLDGVSAQQAALLLPVLTELISNRDQLDSLGLEMVELIPCDQLLGVLHESQHLRELMLSVDPAAQKACGKWTPPDLLKFLVLKPHNLKSILIRLSQAQRAILAATHEHLYRLELLGVLAANESTLVI